MHRPMLYSISFLCTLLAVRSTSTSTWQATWHLVAEICRTLPEKQGIACLQTRAADAWFVFLRGSFHEAYWCAEQSIRHVLPRGTHTHPIPELQVLHGYMDTHAWIHAITTIHQDFRR